MQNIFAVQTPDEYPFALGKKDYVFSPFVWSKKRELDSLYADDDSEVMGLEVWQKQTASNSTFERMDAYIKLAYVLLKDKSEYKDYNHFAKEIEGQQSNTDKLQEFFEIIQRIVADSIPLITGDQKKKLRLPMRPSKRRAIIAMIVMIPTSLIGLMHLIKSLAVIALPYVM